MARLTDDPNDPQITRGVDEKEVPQAEVYLVLSQAELDKGFVRPVRTRYVHLTCGIVTTMSIKIAETYARDPKFYGATYCISCVKHVPVDECRWDDATHSVVGS
jgi:hypothetical protein